MKTLFVTRKYPPQKGGMEIFSKNIYENFQGEKSIIKLDKQNFHLIWFYPFALLKTLAIARKYDVIHFGDGVLGYMAYLVSIFSKKPIAITIHGKEITYKNIFHQGLNIEPLIKSKIHIFTVSSYTKRLCVKRGFNKNRITIIGNCTEKKQIHKKNIEQLNTTFNITLNKNQFILTSVSRLIKRKGHTWFCKNVLPKLPKNITYIIAGTGPEEESLKKIKNKNLILLGQIDDEQKKALLNNSDIFLMPNIKIENDAEGFGISTIEAAALGLPVIGPQIEGLRDVITNNIGTPVSSQHTDSYLEAIKKYLNDKNFLENKSVKAHNYASEEFACDKMANEYQRIFKRISE